MNYVSARKSSIVLWTLSVAYIGIAAVLMWMRTAPFIGLETDGVFYMMAARKLFTAAFTPPTYGGGIGMPLAIAAVNMIVTDTFRSAQLVSAVAGLLYLIAAIRVCSKLFSPVIGLATGALLLVSPVLLANSSSSLTDVLAASLPLAGLWLLLSRTDSSKALSFFAAGFLFGCAYAVRSINFVFLPLPLVVALGENFRQNGKRTMATVVGIVLAAIPQLYVNQKYFGNAFYSDNWRNVAAMVFDWNHVNQLVSFRQALQEAGPTLFVTWIKQFVLDLPIALFHVAYLPVLFFAPGIFLAFRQTTGAHRRVFIMWALCTFGYLLLVAGVWRIEARYFLPALPFIFSSSLLMWQHLTVRAKPLLFAGLSVALVISAAVSLRDARQLLHSQANEFKEAGLYLRQHGDGTGLILASQPSVFFYAEQPGMLIEAIPHSDVDQFNAFVAAKNIRWIAFDERRGYRDDPQLAWLLDPASDVAANRGWKSVFVCESPRLVIWSTHDVNMAAQSVR